MKYQNLGPWLAVMVLATTLIFANRHVFLVAPTPRDGANPEPLPAGLRSDFPIYPAAVHLGVVGGYGEVNGRWYDRSWFASRDDGRTVVEWYRAVLVRQGFTPTGTSQSAGDEQYAFAGDKGVIRLAIFVATDRPTSFLIDFFPTAT